MPLKVTIWMNIPSFYQTDVFNDLAADERIDLRVVYARPLDANRIALGWEVPGADYPVQWLPRRTSFLAAILTVLRQRERFHIVNAMWTESSFAVALITLVLTRTRFSIYSEAPDPWQKRARWKRRLQYCFGRLTAPRAAAIFAISRFAEKFFKSFGVSETVIYPFAYFRKPQRIPEVPPSEEREVIYVGQLVWRKGVDQLLEAIAPLLREKPEWRLTVLGGGELQDSLGARARDSGVVAQIRFEPPIPSSEIPRRIAAADLLVLPSRWDGWGLVINEALTAGVPAIVSDRCGAADLIESGVNGYVFPAENADALRDCLRTCMSEPQTLRELAENARRIGAAISSEAAARYLVDCVVHVEGADVSRPIPPWVTAMSPLLRT